MNAIGIPKIIHQIWSGIDEPLPDIFKMLGDTWKHDYPEWEYRVWDNRMMNDFVQEHYPQYWTAYQQFPYNIQRWDAIRYLLLDKIGGMYVDFDYESLASIEPLIEGKTRGENVLFLGRAGNAWRRIRVADGALFQQRHDAERPESSLYEKNY